MKITNIIPKHKTKFNEEKLRTAPVMNFKRPDRKKSFVDTDCSSVCSRREADVSEFQIEIIEDQMTSEKAKTALNNLGKEFLINSNEICTISTIDSTKDVETNIFKRKNKPIKEDYLIDNITSLKLEKDLIISKNNQELEFLQKHFDCLKIERIETETKQFNNNIEYLTEEHLLLENNYKEEIKFVNKNNKVKSILR